MDNKQIRKRYLSLFLALIMLIGTLPINIFAEPTQSKKNVEDSIESSVGNDAKNAIHAYVGIQVGGDLNMKLQGDALNQQFKPIAGVRAYFQWFENGGYASPVYTAVSDAQGRLNIGCKPYVASDGKIIKFDADTTVSGGNEKYRFWIDDENLPDSLKNHQLQYITGENVVFPSDNTWVSQGGATTDVAPNTISDMKILFMEKPKAFMHKANPTETPAVRTGIGSGGIVSGKVTWDYESPSGGTQWGIVATPSSPAKGVKIKASYLSDYALKQIYSPDTARMLSLSSPDDIRGSKWSYALETQLQKWIQEQVKNYPDKWIAETVTTRSEGTNAEGDYKLQFNGTWGPARNKGVYNYTPPALWPQDKKDRIGTVASSPNDGSFAVGIGQDTKHINIDWMFISADDTEDLRLMTPFNNNWFTGTSGLTGNWGIHSGWAQAAFGVTTAVDTNNNIRADFGFGSPGVNFDITNYDSGANTALPGDVAQTKTTGLPYKNSSDSFVIVWYGPDGKEVGRGTPQQPSSLGTIDSAPLDTSKLTINKTTEYTAKLYRVKPDGSLEAQPIAADSFTVEVSHLFISRYDDVSIANPKANDKEMKGAKYYATELPKDLTMTEADGTIKGKAKEAGSYKVDFKTVLPDPSGNIEGTRARYIAVTDSPLKAGEVGVAYSQAVKPEPAKDPKGKDYIYKMKSVNFISGKEIDGLKVEGDATNGFKITGTPTKEAKATEDVLNGDPGPNVEVTYDIYKTNDTGNEVLVKANHKDKVPLVVRPIVIIPDQDNPGTVPEGYVRVTFKPGEGTFVATDKKVFDVLKGKTIQDAQKADPKLTIPTATANDAKKEHTAWTASTDSKDYKKDLTNYTTALNDNVEFTAKYEDKTPAIADKDNYDPHYTGKSGKPGETVQIDAPKFTKEGQTGNVPAPNGTKFANNKPSQTNVTVDPNTGAITVVIPQDAPVGSTITIEVDVTYPDRSNETVEVKVTVTDNTQPKPEEDKSKTPIVDPVDDGDTSISGKGEPGSDIIINIPGKDPIKTTVDDGGKWIAPIDPAHEGDVIKVVQIEVGKKPSDPAYVTVGGRSIIVPSHDDGGHWWIGGGSFKPVETEEQVIDKTEHGIHIAYIFGYKDHTFRCEGKITRAEAASMIAHIAKLDLSDNSKPDFKDTPSSWYNAAINAMVKKNLMFADKNGNFRPNEPITRGEFARAIQFIDKENKKEAPFMDIKGHEFEEAINQAYSNGRIAGYPDGTFKPDESITRAEAVTILNNFDGRMVRERGIEDVKKDLIKFTDLKPSHWAYYEIIEASNSHAYSRISNDSKEEKWSNLIK